MDNWQTYQTSKKIQKDLKISELDASQTPSALPSVDAAVINNTFVREAGVDFKKAIYVEKKDNNSKQWYNLIAAKKDWEKSDKAKAIKEIIDAYHKDNVKKRSKNLQKEWTNQSSKIRSQECMKEVEKQFSTSYRVLGGMHAFCNRSGTNS